MCCLCEYYALYIRNWEQGGKQSLIDRRGGQQLMRIGGPMFSFVNFAKMHWSSRACEPYHTRACVHVPIEGPPIVPHRIFIHTRSGNDDMQAGMVEEWQDDTGEHKAVASSASTAPRAGASPSRPRPPPHAHPTGTRSRESRVVSREIRDSNDLLF